MTRFLFAALVVLSIRPAMAADPPAATLYKDPQCGCREAYADYLQAEGFMVAVRDTEDLSAIKERHGVPAGYEGCHTVLIDGYVVEGHVPVGAINRLLAERPEVRGISLPGMPLGSPGMSGTRSEPFTIHAFGKGEPTIYAVE